MMNLSRYLHALMFKSFERYFDFYFVDFVWLTQLFQGNTIFRQLLRKFLCQLHRFSLQIDQLSHVSFVSILPPIFELRKGNFPVSVAVKIFDDAFQLTILYFWSQSRGHIFYLLQLNGSTFICIKRVKDLLKVFSFSLNYGLSHFISNPNNINKVGYIF